MALERIKDWARRLKRDVLALWIAAGSARTPMAAKITAFLVAAYALSPVDLIPDFIPVLGLLDDLILLPLGIAVAIRAIPSALMMRFRRIAARRSERPRSKAGLLLVALVWLAVAVAAVWFYRRA